MTVVADFCEERLVQIQRVDHASRSEIKDAADSFRQKCVVIVSALLRVDFDGNRLGLSNGIGKTDCTRIGKTGRDDVLCHIACHICAAAVDLRAVFTGERTAAVGRKPAVGVDHQLATGESGICFKAAKHKSAGWVDENFRLLIDAHVVAGAGNDQPAEFFAQLGRVFIRVILAGDHNGVYALRHTERILHGYLRFAVRSNARNQLFFPAGGEQARDTVRQHDRRGQQFDCFPAGIAVHDALIARAERFTIDSPCNVGALHMLPHLYMQKSSTHVMNTISYGIEGVHYEVIDGFAQSIDGAGYAPGCSWAFGNVFLTTPYVGQPADVWEQTKKLNEEATVSNLIGFSYSNANVQSEVTNVTSVAQEYIGITTGQMPVEETLAAFLDKLDSAGIDVVIADAQAQVDAFLGK